MAIMDIEEDHRLHIVREALQFARSSRRQRLIWNSDTKQQKEDSHGGRSL